MTEQDDKLPGAAAATSGFASGAAAVSPGSAGKLVRLARRLLRRLWQLTFLLLALLAVYVTAGRLLMPVLAGQTALVEARLSSRLDARVEIGELRGAWFRFSPSLEITDLVISSGASAAPQELVVQRAFVELDFVESLLSGQLVINRVSLAGLQLVLQEDADGRWNLAGLAGAGSNGTQQMLDFLLDTRAIALTESSLLLRRAGGTTIAFDSLYLEVLNRGDTHGLQMQFRINGQQSPSQVVVDMQGDPRSFYTAAIHANLAALELAPLLAALPVGDWQLQSLQGKGKFWLDLDSNGLQRLRATVADLQLQAATAAADRAVDVQNATFSLSARPAFAVAGSQTVWEVRLNDLGFDWQQTPWDIPSVHLAIPLDAAAPLTVQVAAMELGMATQMARSALPLPQRAIAMLDTLAPRGALRNVWFETARDGSFPGGFLLRANVQDVAVSAWSGAPAGSGLQGYLQMEAGKGFAEVDSGDLTLHLPRLFALPWHYDFLNTRVSWQYEDTDFRINSTAIEVANSGLKGHVQFDLNSSRDLRGERQSELTLLVGMETMDVALRSAYLPITPRLRDTMQWLDGALQGGQVRDSGFVLRTSTLPTAPPESNTFATWYEVSGGRLQFLPDWPALDNITGSVRVQDGAIDVSMEAASIGAVALAAALATVRPQPDGGSLLSVRGTADATTAQGLDFLRSTPVRDALGAFMDDWEAAGSVHADIDLTLPLGASTAQREIAVEVLSDASELYIPEYALTISAIDGPLLWRHDTGLTARGLRANLFDFPLVANIDTTIDPVAGSTTVINGAGGASVAALQAWPGQPEFVRKVLAFMSGELDYQAELRIRPAGSADGIRTSLDLSTDLVGVQSSLPQPFAKPAAEAAPLSLRLDFLADQQLLTARYSNFVSTQLVLGAAGIDRGQLYFGDRNQTFNVRQTDTNAPGVLINGELPYFNYAEWQAVTDTIATADSGQRTLAEYLRLLDMNLGTLVIAGQELQDIHVQVTYDEAAWQLQGTSALLSGHFTIPADASLPWLVNLDYLRFPAPDGPELGPDGEPVEEEEVDLLAAVDPAALPALDFSTAELGIGEQQLGAFSFQLRPHTNGATISAFNMQAADARISDLQQTGGANIDWRYQAGKHTSSFNGLLAAGNLAAVLPAWGHDAHVESSSARFSGTLQWAGSPLAFSLKDSSGQVLMDISRGRFVNIESSSSRLFGALNFDSLVRRLQLDFSDIFQSGFAFDRISGNLNFKNGLVTTNGAVLIEGPSSRISINGEIDLAFETIAADMQVRIPLGQNISMLAGLLGAWPIALGTYLASKIFQQQMEDFATVIYRLDGPWDNPDAGFEAPVPVTVPPEAP
jgi:uncharacterized protein (TIGR02099 family)